MEQQSITKHKDEWKCYADNADTQAVTLRLELFEDEPQISGL